MAIKTEEKRQAIIKAATEAFQELGFERTSMSEICARVGGSKATLYNYFPSKEDLFAEIMFLSNEAEFEAIYHSIDPLTEDIAEALRHFGESLLSFLYSPQVQSSRHLAIAESGRSEQSRLVYERGVLRSENLVAEFLLTAMQLGKLKSADPLVATRHLQSLLESELLERFLFQLLGDVTSQEIKAVTARAVDVFMAAYGPKSS